jgi:hypothetical protein
MGLGYKVPFREVYTDTVRSWAKETIWCHLVLRFFADYVDQMICKCGSYGDPQ